MNTILIKDAKIINDGTSYKGSLLIEGEKISKIFRDNIPDSVLKSATVIDADGKWVLPGVIDTHVHFREPGLTEKGDFESESRAAVAGGVTTVFDMPNTNPQTTSAAMVEQKAEIASKKCLTNYGFYIGATNENVDEIKNLDPKSVAGVKIFMGISTGGMLVNSKKSLEDIFASAKVPVVTHNEDVEMINANAEAIKAKYPEGQIPIFEHMNIRSSDACYKCTSYVIDLAKKYGTQLHVLHLSTKKEIALFDRNADIENKKITAEVCPNYLWFDENDYERLGAKIKCNPAIKKEKSRENLLIGLEQGSIDTVASDHSPHLLSQKQGDALTATSGIPSIQHTLPMMLQLAKKSNLSREQVVEKMCHNPAKIFKLEKRGYIRKGYYADLVIISPDDPYTIEEKDLLYKCGWSPMVGEQLQYKVEKTFVNGNLVYDEGKINDEKKGQRVSFDR
ncbi:MAG: dihydroorotase [Bacteroidales bacterium]|nr:dihydroorotase [Candidatus Scybalocola fimicaballi]